MQLGSRISWTSRIRGQVFSRPGLLPANRPGPIQIVRGLQIRRVVSGIDATGQLPNNNVTREKGSPATRRTRKGSRKGLETVDVDAWVSKLCLPPPAYYEAWQSSLTDEENKDHLQTARKFVLRWKDDISLSFRGSKYMPSAGQQDFMEVTGHFEMPLIGYRKVVAYGRYGKEVRYNVELSLIAALFEHGDLDVIFNGTLATRSLLKVFEHTAQYGIYPRMTHAVLDKESNAPQHSIALTVTPWKIHAEATAPTYIDALRAVVDAYKQKLKDRDWGESLDVRHVRNRMHALNLHTAYHVLQFILQKLKMNTFKTDKKLDGPGPQHVAGIWHKNTCFSARIPTLRKIDAPVFANLTAVIQLLQKFGYNNMDGFKAAYEASRSQKLGSDLSREPSETGMQPEAEVADYSARH